MKDLRRLDAISLHSLRAPERRDHAARQALIGRVRSEFAEMPGACLTVAQAGRLFSVSPDAMARIFSELVEDGILRLMPDGRYRKRESAA